MDFENLLSTSGSKKGKKRVAASETSSGMNPEPLKRSRKTITNKKRALTQMVIEPTTPQITSPVPAAASTNEQAVAYILDPLYLIRDTSGKYLPPFKCLTTNQEKEVNKLITRLVSREEAHIALMELMKWRTKGLDPVYAWAVQMKERDPVTGKMRAANPLSSRLVWETYLTEFYTLGKVAVRLIFLHATSCGFKCNWSLLRWVFAHGHSRVGMEKAQKLIFIAAHSKLERRDFLSDEDKDAELLACKR
uniref:Uncharacterized protein n=1 Tax=Cannabis sativa TaxID=3483 RepID=A0A803PSS7_CANSA